MHFDIIKRFADNIRSICILIQLGDACFYELNKLRGGEGFSLV